MRAMGINWRAAADRAVPIGVCVLHKTVRGDGRAATRNSATLTVCSRQNQRTIRRRDSLALMQVARFPRKSKRQISALLESRARIRILRLQVLIRPEIRLALATPGKLQIAPESTAKNNATAAVERALAGFRSSVNAGFINASHVLVVMSCVELFSGHVYGCKFAVEQMHVDSGITHVRERMEKIREIQNRKVVEKHAAAAHKYLDEFVVSCPALGKSTDMIGLVGEMICETYHERCKRQVLFYAKWRETGSSRSNGVDLIFEESGRLSVIECKHVHSRQSAGKESRLLEAIRTGMREHSYYRASVFLAARQRVLSKRIRGLEAEGSDTFQEHRKISVIKRALDDGFESQVDLAVDREDCGVADYAEFGSRSDKIQPAGERNRALLLLVDELHAITEAA